jgi:hypothetical protein
VLSYFTKYQKVEMGSKSSHSLAKQNSARMTSAKFSFFFSKLKQIIASQTSFADFKNQFPQSQS